MAEESGTVEVYLYGRLRRYAPRREVWGESLVRLPVGPAETTVGEVIRRVGIDPAEVSNVFRNGSLAAPVSRVRAGDRLGLFPTDMGLLYI